MKMLTLLLLALLAPIESKNATRGNSDDSGLQVQLTIEERIASVLSDSGITDIATQKLMIAQAKFESGNFKNRLSVEHNNVFSLHHSDYDTLSLGRLASAEGCACFASYRSVEDATRAYLRLIARMKIPRQPNPTVFADALKRRGYYTSSVHHYEQGLRYWIRSLDTFSITKPKFYGSEQATTGSQ